MDIASIAHDYLSRFKTKYGHSISTDQWSALNAILGCRTKQYGEIHLSCSACPWRTTRYQSCGHRSCNRCQNYNTTQWLDRQVSKLLPVEYFMVTFTLPAELRSLAKHHQKLIYAFMFECAVSTLKTFALNDKSLAAELAMTAVLHTHTRRLDYHPHVHLIVPGGGINRRRREWRKCQGKYLFNGKNLAAVFRGKLLHALEKAEVQIPPTPGTWVAQCQHVGKGLPALKYLSRYLYRGVISNQRIVQDDGNFVTFEYTDSQTGNNKTRRLRSEDFIKLVLQHTLPKGFRRVRDFGWLHGNAKKLLKIIQWALQVAVPTPDNRKRPNFTCQHCHAVMAIVGFSRSRLEYG